MNSWELFRDDVLALWAAVQPALTKVNDNAWLTIAAIFVVGFLVLVLLFFLGWWLEVKS